MMHTSAGAIEETAKQQLHHLATNFAAALSHQNLRGVAPAAIQIAHVITSPK